MQTMDCNMIYLELCLAITLLSLLLTNAEPFRITYGRHQLLQLGLTTQLQWTPPTDFPLECLRPTEQRLARIKKKHGSRGGIKRRVRARGSKPPLPTIDLSNVRSLRNKIDELHASTQYLYEYRDSCLLCFSETWLNPTVIDDSLSLPGFGTPLRLDRQQQATGKSIGGGLCMYINTKWCKHHIIRHTFNSPHLELLSVSLGPTYLPREFGQLFVCLVYIPPDANYKEAADEIYRHIQELETASPDTPKLILGDFNGCSLSSALPHYQQYVKCATHGSKTIDLCYGNIKNAYKAINKPPIGGSDHNTVFLLPSYRQKLKREKPKTTSVGGEGVGG